MRFSVNGQSAEANCDPRISLLDLLCDHLNLLTCGSREDVVRRTLKVALSHQTRRARETHTHSRHEPASYTVMNI